MFKAVQLVIPKVRAMARVYTHTHAHTAWYETVIKKEESYF